VEQPTITILPGIPGKPDMRVDDGHVPYPDTTSDMVKILRELGFETGFTGERRTGDTSVSRRRRSGYQSCC
jgi:hypothetical protein